MKDQVFSGRTVAEAVEVAGRTLGLSPDAIRYVVLERDTPGLLGMGGTPARIAVLLEAGERGRPGPAPVAALPARARDPRARIRSFVRELAEAGGLDLTVDVEENEEQVLVRVFGDDRSFLLENGGAGFAAFEHVVQRGFGHGVHPRRLVVECEGYREAREAGLRARAREMADAVCADGRSRETEPMNSYERRIVHMTLTEYPGVRTFSVGEGSDRRVTIALGDAETPADPEGGSGDGLAH